MEKFFVETERFVITEADESMAEAIHKNSLDEDNRRFVPDEVFETPAEAQKIVQSFLEWYKQERAPLVYPIILKAKLYTGNGYATEAVKAFLPIIMPKLKIDKIIGECLQENVASAAVLEKCGFVLEYKGLGNYQGESRNICKYLYHAQAETI